MQQQQQQQQHLQHQQQLQQHQETWELERRYSVPGALDTRGLEASSGHGGGASSVTLGQPPASEDLHAWSIYRQNLNSDFTDSALGSAEKSPLPYGNFQLRDSTVQSILRHPRYGPRSPLASNSYTYLKFGLPRVLPPSSGSAGLVNVRTGNIVRDAGSSGYDSSEEGRLRAAAAAAHAAAAAASAAAAHQACNATGGRLSAFACVPAMRSARSDPDFRNAIVTTSRDNHSHIGLQHHPNHHHHHLHNHHQLQLQQQQQQQQHQKVNGGRESRLRSSSEANLLHTSSAMTTLGVSSRPMANRRHSIAPIDPGLIYETRHVNNPHLHHNHNVNHTSHHHHHHHHNHHQQQQHQHHPTTGSSIMTYPAAVTSVSPQPTSLLQVSQPHLQMRAVEVAGATVRGTTVYLRGISLEAGAGDVLAIMSTSEREGTLIMETIAGIKRIKRGEILLNGQSVSAKTLRSTIAYLPADTPEAGLSPSLTALQCINFYRVLRGAPGVSSLEAELILQELGLEATKHCLVSSLTCSETRRLGLACRLIKGTQILTLDRPTRGLDIFDAFFLVEYLRQWALRSQRLVILTLHPPTYEILTMLSRITLTSGGRVMYSGPRRDMLPYFALAEFPCPPFKNPSDYYLDLVTLDDLSAEAMLESSQRIDHLAELARARLAPLSDPGPPGPLSCSNAGANSLVQIYALFLRKLIYSQPWSLASLTRKIIVAATLGVILGAVFWDVATEANLYLRDRIGFHYASLGVLFWPLSLLGMLEINRCRPFVESDIKDGLYNRFVYIMVELLCNLPSWCLVYTAYLAPSYVMSGLHIGPIPPNEASMMQPDENLENLWRFLSIGLAYLLLQHFVCIFFAYLCATSWSFLALLLSGFAIGQTTLAAGVTLHADNLYSWYTWASPLRWALSLLLPELHSSEMMMKLKNCKAKQIQRQDIITQSACEVPDGKLAMREIGLDDSAGYVQDEWMLGCLGTVLLGVILTFLLIRHLPTKKSVKSVPNKP